MPITLYCECCGKPYDRVPSKAEGSRFCSKQCFGKACGGSGLKDETGKRYGRWTVLEKAESNDRGDAYWLCRCDCGTERVVKGGSLRSGDSKSCGCYHREVSAETAARNFSRPIEPGTRFNRLIVLEPMGSDGTYLTYKCRCDCGNEIVTRSNSLRTGNTQSCGCLNRERVESAVTTHGMSGTKVFNRWRSRVRLESDSDWTLEMEQLLFQVQDRCVVCGAEDDLSVDHVIPVSKGGHAEPGNVVVLCRSCNSAKNDRDAEDLPEDWQDAIVEAMLSFDDIYETVAYW